MMDEDLDQIDWVFPTMEETQCKNEDKSVITAGSSNSFTSNLDIGEFENTTSKDKAFSELKTEGSVRSYSPVKVATKNRDSQMQFTFVLFFSALCLAFVGCVFHFHFMMLDSLEELKQINHNLQQIQEERRTTEVENWKKQFLLFSIVSKKLDLNAEKNCTVIYPEPSLDSLFNQHNFAPSNHSEVCAKAHDFVRTAARNVQLKKDEIRQRLPLVMQELKVKKEEVIRNFPEVVEKLKSKRDDCLRDMPVIIEEFKIKWNIMLRRLAVLADKTGKVSKKLAIKALDELIALKIKVETCVRDLSDRHEQLRIDMNYPGIQ